MSVGTLPDLFFAAGRPDTQYIRPVKVNFNSGWAEGVVVYSDCQAYARSNLAGVSIQESYGQPGTIRGPGQWAVIDQSSGLPPSGQPIRYYPVWGYPEQQSGRVPVIYDGSGTRQSGTIDIVVNQGDEFSFHPRLISQVNVYILPGGGVSSAFIVTSTAAATDRESLTLNHPLLNGEPNTRVFAQHYGSSGWDHPIAVWYDPAVGRWKIRNEDGTPMPPGLSFSVRIDPSATLVQTAPDSQPHYLIIRHPEADGNPYATIIATPVSAGDRRMDQPYAVAYVHPHWQVVTPRAMPTSQGPSRAGFHVKVIGASHYVDDTRNGDPSGFTRTELTNGAGIDIIAGSGRISGGAKILSHWCWTLNSTQQPIIATINWTPLPPPAPVNYNWVSFKYIGVGVRGNIAQIFYEDGSFLDGRAAFNVWGPYRETCP